MPRADQEQIPAAPFVAWTERRLEEIRSDDTLRLTDKATNVPASQVLADELGISERRLRGYRSSQDSQGHPTDTFARERIEDMLDHAGVPFSDVYSELAAAEDVELEPDAYCPACRTDVTPIRGACPWCDTEARARPPRSRNRKGQGRRLTDEQVRAAHRLHVTQRLTAVELGERLHRQAGYSNPKSCAKALIFAFGQLGLEFRQGANLREPSPTLDARRERERRARGKKPCRALTLHGTRCKAFALPGQSTCRRHSSEGKQRSAQTLRLARSLQAPGEPILSPGMVQELVIMHTQFDMSCASIARALQPRTRSNSWRFVATLVSEELHKRGVYEGYKRAGLSRAA